MRAEEEGDGYGFRRRTAFWQSTPLSCMLTALAGVKCVKAVINIGTLNRLACGEQRETTMRASPY